jgi:hypothetical protein
MKSKTTLLVFFVFLSLSFRAQSVMPDVIASSGDFFFNSSGQIQWTLGEVMVETYANSGNSVNQGFHQSFILGTGINTFNPFSLTVFPNPTNRFVSLTVNKSEESFMISLTDITGKILQSKEFNSADKTIAFDLENYSNGVYFLKVSGSTADQFFRVIKTN